MKSKKIQQPFTYEVLLSQEEYQIIVHALYTAGTDKDSYTTLKEQCTELGIMFERGITE